MVRLIQLLLLATTLLLAGQLCQAACTLTDSTPKQSQHPPNQDALARLLQAQDRCPLTALDFRNLVERSGAQFQVTMVTFFGFHNADAGELFVFEIVSGKLTGSDLVIEPGDLLFGHFLTSSGSSLVLTSGGLLVEAIAWDPAKQMFNFYELVEDDKTHRTAWFYRGDSKLVLDDIALLYRRRAAGKGPFADQLRCSACHVNGGLIQKELASPHNDWWISSRPLPPGGLTPDATVMKIFQDLADADQLTKLVETTSRRLLASPEYRKALRSRTMQEQLRPLFCPVELNIESDRDAFDDRAPAVQIPAGFFADPRLGVAAVAIPRKNYEKALKQVKSRMRGAPGRTDADHAWLTPVKANSDMLVTETLVEMGVVDDEFVADVLAVDFTNPVFSASRCALLKLVPAGDGADFLPRFQAALKASSQAGASLLLQNLTDPKRDATFHREQVHAYLEACQNRASKPEAAIEWVGLLTQRRAQINKLELSRHPRGQILEPPDRIVFPSASVPPKRLDLTVACKVRPL